MHLHLLELAHAEDELTCDDLVAEGLTNLCDTEGDAHAAGLLDIEEVHEDALSRLGTQINVHGGVGAATHLGLEHEVELTNVGPVLGTADGVHDLVINDNLLQLCQVVVVHCLLVAGVQDVALLLVLEDAGVGLAEHCLVELVAEALGSLLTLLVDLLLDLGNLVLDEDIGAIALLAVTVVDQGIVERIHMARGLPDGGVHEDGAVDAHDVLV